MTTISRERHSDIMRSVSLQDSRETEGHQLRDWAEGTNPRRMHAHGTLSRALGCISVTDIDEMVLAGVGRRKGGPRGKSAFSVRS